MKAVSRKALGVLDLIEAIEMRSLEWGFTDGSLSEDEVFALAHRVGNAADTTPTGEDIIEELVSAKLIFELHSIGSAIRFRSRFAEMMRLLAANRQLFPNKPWRGAPQLVADFRVDRRPRRFPRRDRLPSEILDENATTIAPCALSRDLWQALTSPPGMMLAAFQERVAVRVAAPAPDGGTIVTAGTGSGKTLAFYLPGMIQIGAAIESDHWVKAVAIYPRIELLKDQFAEAFRMARTIDMPLDGHGRRCLIIGALFGATPSWASRNELIRKKWEKLGQDFVCPWMRCPECEDKLLWRASDIDAKIEHLVCAQHRCRGVVKESQIILTRTRLQREPPDILFTTTEMLNQRLSDHWMRGLFGLGLDQSKKPFVALLDEVHTYEGVAGAQAAITLRRWRHLLAAPIHWVGLSATLRDAARFFADLTGAHPDQVMEITPRPDEYEESGAEYQILLRGDPSLRASLLSTTIQSSMLVPRILDPPGATDTLGAFGRRAFLFTDDLDVTNRLFDDLRDAEAFTIFGKPDPHRQPLAHIRGTGPDAVLRDVEGQRWRICEDIGHPLERRLVVGRTSSQDAGVNYLANIVVATASLEVGFNDPLVGAVIQHKAPRSMASFLQRKGRAGRYRVMRPITLTILSDYGRDRAFYQAYEQLFEPTLEAQHLPIRNPYVLKIQAVFALFDWLSERTFGYEKAWQWDLLSRPTTHARKERLTVIDRTKGQLIQLIRGDDALIRNFREHLVASLNVDDVTAESLLWEAPRSLLLEVVPTLVRRLFWHWKKAFPSAESDLDLQIDYHPLPDFVPRSLFSDLSLPEVRVIVPPATTNHKERIEAMPITQALSQLVPGRVTRRFAPERGALSHWVPVDPAFPQQERLIGDFAEEHELVGTFTGRFNDTVDDGPFLVFRPWTIRLSKATRSDALPSSNARLAWHTDIVANGEPLRVPIPFRSEWRDYVKAIDFHLHRFRSNINVRRFAPTVHANIRTLQGDFPVTLCIKSNDNRPAAVGFELEVDGFHIDLSLPNAEVLATSVLPPKLLATCRMAYLRDMLRSDKDLPYDLNVFQRDWLFQVLISALISDATITGRSLDVVADDLLDEDRLKGVFTSVMDELFGTIPPDLQDYDQDEGLVTDDDSSTRGSSKTNSTKAVEGDTATTTGSSRLQQALEMQLDRVVVCDQLRVLADYLNHPNPKGLGAWLRRLVLDTLGEAMLQACLAAGPRHATVDNLLVDIQDNTEGNNASVWITESTLGGAGVLQAFAEGFVSEPRNFFSALEAALAPTDLELVDGGLREIVLRALCDSDVASCLAQLRATKSHNERATIWQSLSHSLTQSGGIDLSHALSVSLNNRLLRSGSGPQLDRLLLDLQDSWDRLEHRFGLSIGLREFAYICSKDTNLASSVRKFLSATLPAAAVEHVSVLAVVTHLLWPRADEVRQRALQSYNPYRRERSTDPAVVRHLLLGRSTALIELANSDWQEQLDTAFASQGACRLVAQASDVAALREAIVLLIATPVNVGILQFFPIVERVERSEGRIVVNLTLREQL